MQLIAIVSGLKGHKSNFDTGIIDKKQFDEHFKDLTDQLLTLGDVIYDLKWDGF